MTVLLHQVGRGGSQSVVFSGVEPVFSIFRKFNVRKHMLYRSANFFAVLLPQVARHGFLHRNFAFQLEGSNLVFGVLAPFVKNAICRELSALAHMLSERTWGTSAARVLPPKGAEGDSP